MEKIIKNSDNSKIGNKIIEKMASINITGNIIPMIWFKKILYPSGKPNLLAINILADIVYWYRPTEIRDEKTGEIIAYNKKFSSDLLQRNYEQISKMFGCSKREATNAIICLENLGLIKRVFRTINNNGLIMSNMLFLELNPDKVMEITYQDLQISEPIDNSNQSGGCHFQKGEGSLSKGIGVTFKSETYTENTTENITQNISKKEINKERNEENLEQDNSYNNNGNILEESSNNGNSENNKKITTNQKVGSKISKVHNKGETLTSVINSYTNNEEMQELLAEFVEIREKMKKPLTVSSFKRNLKVLDRASLEDGGTGTEEEKIKIIERTVINSWQSFYSLKNNVYMSSSTSKDKPSYDLDAYEKLDGITTFGKLKNKSLSLDEMLRIEEEEREKEYIEVEANEND